MVVPPGYLSSCSMSVILSKTTLDCMMWAMPARTKMNDAIMGLAYSRLTFYDNRFDRSRILLLLCYPLTTTNTPYSFDIRCLSEII